MRKVPQIYELEAQQSTWQPYPAYKESGAVWLDTIPSHWTVAPVWTQFRLGRGRVICNLEIQDNKGEYPVYSSQTEANGIMGYIDTYDFEGDYITWTTDGANAGTVFLRSGKFNCTNVCGTLKATQPDVYLPFFAYALELRTNSYVRHDINPKLMNSVMAGIRVQKPPLDEQRTIASFLDRETARIDALIAKKEQLIALLQEQRSAIISHAVTKGLDPDVPMKDSGVEWLGEIPAHWEVIRLKYIVDWSGPGIQMGPFGSSLTNIEYSPTGFKLYGQQNTIADDFEVGQRWITDEQFCALAKYQILPGDIVLTRKGSIGYARAVPENIQMGIADSDTIRVRVNTSKASADFIVLILQEALYIDVQMQLAKRGAVLSGLNTDTISNLVFTLPPPEEQSNIISYVRHESENRDDVLSGIRLQIEILQEYRTALISAAVTGKIDVRGT